MKWRKAKAEPRIERAGEWLHEAHRRRERFAPLPPELAPRDLGEAYAIQGQFVGRRAQALGPVTGYKIALTTPVMQELRAQTGAPTRAGPRYVDLRMARDRGPLKLPIVDGAPLRFAF